MRITILIASLGMFALAAAPQAGAAVGEEQAGVASAVNAATRGIAPISGERIIHIGTDLVIDEFVYDPATGAGRLTMTAAKGLLRFVGGQLSKQDAVRINTPTAGIGIRGGIGIVQIGEATTGTLVFGELTMQSGDVERLITRSGFGSTSSSPDEPPSPPTPRPPPPPAPPAAGGVGRRVREPARRDGRPRRSAVGRRHRRGRPRRRGTGAAPGGPGRPRRGAGGAPPPPPPP